MNSTSNLINEEVNGGPSKTLKEETWKYGSSREPIGNKYADIREQSGQASKVKLDEKNGASAKGSLLDTGNSRSNNTTGGPSSGLTSTLETMKSGFQNFKARIGSKKFLPIRQLQENKVSLDSSSESLDEIFQRLKRPSSEHATSNDEDYEIENNIAIKLTFESIIPLQTIWLNFTNFVN